MLVAMTEQSIRREAVSDQVFSLLRDRILNGVLAPGDALTSERELSAEFGVNRHAIREAVKRLQQARLVEVSQGGRTRVLDWRRSAGLDLALGLAGAPTAPPALAGLVRDALEMRACIGADAARLCAQRGSREAVEALLAATDAYEAVGADLAALDAADIAWWRLIVEGSGNLAYLLAFNTLVGGTLLLGTVPPPEPRAAELLDVAGHRRLARHIADGEADAAERLAREILSRGIAAFPNPNPQEVSR
jgi:DNA-binding FadR family transcriptional regulator